MQRVDINECNVNNGGCDQICNNTYGSYRCTCEEGYTLEFDGFNCSGKHVHLLIQKYEELQNCFSCAVCLQV